MDSPIWEERAASNPLTLVAEVMTGDGKLSRGVA